jgi:hypothetical protein
MFAADPPEFVGFSQSEISQVGKAPPFGFPEFP